MFMAVNDVRLFFDVAGEKFVADGAVMRERPTVVLLHGGPGLDHTMFKPSFAPLTKCAQVIYLDHRGNGRSESGDPARWTLDQWGDDVRTFCDQAGITKPIVLGYSFGGFVAQSYATRHPDHPGKLVLYSTGATMDDTLSLDAFEAIAGKQVRAVAAAYYANPTAETRALFRATCMPLYHTKPDDPHFNSRSTMNDSISNHFFSGEAKQMDFRPALNRITCPTLVIAGAKDPRVPLALAEMIAAQIRPDLVQFRVFDECGHGPHIEEPEQVMTLLQEFVLR